VEDIGRREFITSLAKTFLFSTFPVNAFCKTLGNVKIELPAYSFQKYVIPGKRKGKKILVIGGIHGNEPGAYKAAEILSRVKVERGELIIAPRTNVVSILADVRGYNGDMNRKFQYLSRKDPDYERVQEIKELIAETKPDLVLSLHDGFGFHSVNKRAWGQCIVIDEEVYKTFNLGKIAKTVAENVNRHIRRRKWKIPVYNTHTFSPSTKHPEQKKSLTYYCLSKQNVPAFCLETSKQLPSLRLKVLFHLMMLKEFFKIYGVEISPDFDVLEKEVDRFLTPAKFYSVKAEINGRIVEISSKKTFHLHRGSYFKVLSCHGTEGTNVICKDVNLNWRSFHIKRRVALTLKDDFRKIFDFRVVVV